MARLGPQARWDAAWQLAHHLGPQWVVDEAPGTGISSQGDGHETEDGPLDALPLRHQPTGLTFLAVPGGEYHMGITDKDVETIRDYGVSGLGPGEPSFDQIMGYGRPVRPVRVLPFLWSRTLIAVETGGVLGPREKYDRTADHDRVGAARTAAGHGFRLPSEAEFEWVARDAGAFAFTLDVLPPLDPETRRQAEETEDDDEWLDLLEDLTPYRNPPSRFGVEDLFVSQWMADDWHSTFEGAPATSLPWHGGDPQGVRRGDPEDEGCLFNWEHCGTESLHYLLAGVREPGAEPLMHVGYRPRAAVRFALSIDPNSFRP